MEQLERLNQYNNNHIYETIRSFITALLSETVEGQMVSESLIDTVESKLNLNKEIIASVLWDLVEEGDVTYKANGYCALNDIN